MAEKRVIEIEIKSEQANKAINDLTKSNTDLAASFEDVYGEMQPLSGRMGELEDRLYELALAGKQNTQEYKDLQTEVSRFKKIIAQTDASVDSAAGTMSQKLGGALGGITSAFELGQGVMVSFGVESQEVEEALLKVQSAMAISQGIQGIKESISSFQSLGATVKNAFSGMTTASKAFIATGVGLVIAAVAYAISEMTSAAEAAAAEIENLEKATENLNDELQFSQKQLSDYSRKAIADAKLRGASEKELLQIELDASQKSIEQRWNNANQRIKANNRIINNENATAEQIKKANSEIFKAQQEQLELKREARILSSEFALREKEIADDEIAKNKEKSKEAKERAKEAKEAREKLKADKDKQLEEDIARAEKEREFMLNDDIEEGLRQQLVDSEAAKDEIRQEAIAKQEEEDLMLMQFKGDIYKQDVDNFDEAEAKKKQLREDNLKSGVQQAKLALDLIASIAESNAGEDESRQKKAFQLRKAANIASATIDGYKAVLSTYADTPGGPVIKGVAAAIAGAFALLQISNIAKSDFKSSATSSTSSSPSGGSSGAGTSSVITPNFNIVGNAQATNPLAGLGEGIIQAYVVSGDVTTAQSLDRNRVNNATFG
jgi:hypothetical protein